MLGCYKNNKQLSDYVQWNTLFACGIVLWIALCTNHYQPMIYGDDNFEKEAVYKLHPKMDSLENSSSIITKFHNFENTVLKLENLERIIKLVLIPCILTIVYVQRHIIINNFNYLHELRKIKLYFKRQAKKLGNYILVQGDSLLINPDATQINSSPYKQLICHPEITEYNLKDKNPKELNIEDYNSSLESSKAQDVEDGQNLVELENVSTNNYDDKNIELINRKIVIKTRIISSSPEFQTFLLNLNKPEILAPYMFRKINMSYI